LCLLKEYKLSVHINDIITVRVVTDNVHLAYFALKFNAANSLDNQSRVMRCYKALGLGLL